MSVREEKGLSLEKGNLNHLFLCYRKKARHRIIHRSFLGRRVVQKSIPISTNIAKFRFKTIVSFLGGAIRESAKILVAVCDVNRVVLRGEKKTCESKRIHRSLETRDELSVFFLE